MLTGSRRSCRASACPRSHRAYRSSISSAYFSAIGLRFSFIVGVSSSPQKYKNLKPGRHRFQVRATDQADNTDRTPAKYGFKVLD